MVTGAEYEEWNARRAMPPRCPVFGGLPEAHRVVVRLESASAAMTARGLVAREMGLHFSPRVGLMADLSLIDRARPFQGRPGGKVAAEWRRRSEARTWRGGRRNGRWCAGCRPRLEEPND